MIDYKTIPVSELMPHSSPMVLIDKIVNYDDSGLISEISIVKDCRFYDAEIQGVPSWVGIEYMAQSIAALAGIQAKEKNEQIKLGFLLGSRRYNIHSPHLKTGNTYQIQVKHLYMDSSGLASFDCQIVNNEDKIVDARLNVFETDKAQQLIGIKNE